MARFFLPSEFEDALTDSLPKTILLEGEDAFHLSVSLRARIGDEVTLCSPKGMEYSCRIASISGGKKSPVVVCEPYKAEPSQNEPLHTVTLFQGMPKGKKTDLILQKCTELGVGKVVFVYSDRAVPELREEEKKCSRFRRIAEEAAKQCGRGKRIPVSVMMTTEEAIAEMKQSDVAFVCYEEEGEKSLKSLISSSYTSLAFFVGPEGGISEREVDLFRQAEIPTVTLGKRILRTETAGSSVLSMILYEKEL